MAKGGKKKTESPPPAQEALASPASTTTTALRPLVLDVRLLLAVLGIGAVVGFLWLVRDVVVPLLLVCVLTFVGAPVVAWLQRRRVPRALGAGVFVLGAVLGLAALLSMVVPALVRDFSALIEQTPELFRNVAQWTQRTFGIVVPTRFGDLSNEASQEILDALKGGVGTGVGGVLRGAAGAAAILADVVLVPVLTYFALVDLPRAKPVVAALVPRGLRRVLAYYVPLVEVTLAKLVRGQLVVGLIIALLYMLGLSIAGVPLAIAISVIAGVAYLVPFASGIVTFVLSAAFCAIELGSESLPHIVGAVICVGIVTVLEAYVLTPRIVGEQAGLSPLAAILAVILGAASAGFLGALFALPVGAVVALILREQARRPLSSSPSEAAA